MKRTLPHLIALSLALFLTTGCDSNSAMDQEPEPLETTMAIDVPADPIIGLENGRPVGAGVTTYYSLRTNSVVTNAASTDWDIALQGTSLYVNGGTSGPGQGAAQVVTGVFEELMEAPESGYQTDAEGGLAIATGSGNGWYNYNPATQTVTPIPGRVLMIKTANGLYAKVKILSYYQGMPDPVTAESVSRYYTFEFVLQPDGTRSF